MVETNSKQPIWESQGQEKRLAVQGMFSKVAPTYDRANSLLSFAMHQRWRRVAVSKLNLSAGETAIDLCCGTGDFLPLLREKVGNDGNLLGLDFCLPMLRQSSTKDEASTLGLADACQLPVRSESADAVTVGWGIRNVPDIDQAHAEICRALRPGRRFVSIDCAMPTGPVSHFLTRLTRKRILTTIGSLFGLREAYQYLEESTTRFRTREELADSMRRAGFTDVRYKDLMFGNICIHWGTKA
jgi:demethylmenaquinone methyltransferase / 2-methoxy-6-polyprenyl-1,4-benzoquinol methylase